MASRKPPTKTAAPAPAAEPAPRKRAAKPAAPAAEPAPRKRAAKPPSGPVAAPAPAAEPAPPTPAAKRGRKVATPAAPVPLATLPVGVYCDHNRHTAILIKRGPGVVWYLTMMSERITVECVGEDRFKRLFPLANLDYPLRVAVRKYHTSYLLRDETTQKVLNLLLEKL